MSHPQPPDQFADGEMDVRSVTVHSAKRSKHRDVSTTSRAREVVLVDKFETQLKKVGRDRRRDSKKPKPELQVWNVVKVQLHSGVKV